MTLGSTVRRLQAEHSRKLREAKKRQRELERRAKEAAKLSALEQARLDVETYDNALDVLLSVHKEPPEVVDWRSVAASLPPHPPVRRAYQETKARQRSIIATATKNAPASIDDAIQMDEREYRGAMDAHIEDLKDWESGKNLANRVIDGDPEAYITAIEEMGPFAELAGIGSSLHFTVCSARVVEIVLDTNGKQAVPTEQKTLTSSGKVSVRPMPKSRFLEIYQDYICGSILRVAREMFALLPVETLVITATAESLDASTGQTGARPFLSVIISRETLANLNFELLDPSDAIMAMVHRGELKASRKTGDFEFIVPLTNADISKHSRQSGVAMTALVAEARRLRADMIQWAEKRIPAPERVDVEDGEES
jgi:hypothetical protein